MSEDLAYFVGIALGDGNLSNPNGRAVRLRVTCDNKYPLLQAAFAENFQRILPDNKVSMVPRKHCTDISVYSNHLPQLLGWRWDGGPKNEQNVGVPTWITRDATFIRSCLRGLFQTDGCQYRDRGYTMVSFVNTASRLAHDVFDMIRILGYKPNMQKFLQQNCKVKHTIRVAIDAQQFIDEIGYWKK